MDTKGNTHFLFQLEGKEEQYTQVGQPPGRFETRTSHKKQEY